MIRAVLFIGFCVTLLTACTPHVHLFGVYYIDKEWKTTTRPAETRPADKTVEDIVKEHLR